MNDKEKESGSKLRSPIRPTPKEFKMLNFLSILFTVSFFVLCGIFFLQYRESVNKNLDKGFRTLSDVDTIERVIQ